MAGYAYDPEAYKKNLAKMGASIGTPQAAQTPKTTGAIPQAANTAPTSTPPVAATPKPQGAIPQSTPAPGSTASHQAYINSTVPGGLSAYQANQQARYDDAYARGDQDLINRLNADVQRVGYSLHIPNMPQTQPTPQAAAPAPMGAIPQSMPNYNDIAAAEQARYLAERERIANQQKQGLTSAFQRSNAILGENRTLEDAELARTLNPFSGRTSYAKGMVGRQRTLADESAQGNFNAAIQGVEQGLADDRNTAAQAIMARAYQLEQDAKNFDLDYAGVFGQGQNGGPLSLAARQQAYNQYADNRDYNYQVGRDQVADDRWKAEFDENKRQYGEQFAYQKLRDKIGDDRWKAEFDEDVRRFGIDDAWRKYQEKQVASRAASGGGSGRSSGGNKPSSDGVIKDLNKPRTVDSMITYIKNNTPGIGNMQGPPPPNMLEFIENAILSNPNLSEKQIDELYAKFGIPPVK